jgi:hydrogenase expression/formation protein HypC
MCLAVAARIVSVHGAGLERAGTADFAGEARPIGLAMVPEAGPGDWVVVHAGYALNLLSEEEAARLAGLSDEIAGLL